MAVTPQLIKELREMTGAGMMDCKKALDSTNGVIDEAIIWLRENGLSKAAKKADRVAAEGITFAKKTDKKSVIFEVNSETDFVSKNERFKILIDEIADGLLKNKFKDVEEAKKIKLASGKTINDACLEATATIGEKIEFRRVSFVENNNMTTLYNHANKRISVLLEFVGKISEEDAYNIAMHVAAMSPKFLTKDEVPAEMVQTELNIIKENTEKPEKLSEEQFQGVLQGKLSKVLSDYVLFDQPFVMDEKVKVGQLIKQKGAELKTMIRFEVGEGIQKVETDFAAEVAAQLKGN